MAKATTPAAAEAALVSEEAVAAQLHAVEHYLFEERGFKAPQYGRSKLPPE